MQPIPDLAALIKIAQSPAGQKLLSRLQGADLDSITSAAASGNLEEAKQKLSKLLSDGESQELIKQLEKQI